ncbi:MAG TPA: MOSC N-terminal beta barrel domain-containing protein [Acidimicrobiales bacterium]|nr:MOSC N-terminal beta barrel domain-containing protein [Acidimicrobiales bacterium]
MGGEEQMLTSDVVGIAVALWRFPVKSMLGERLDEAQLSHHGIVGDRAYALLDAETAKVVSAKSVKHFPDLFSCRATFVDSPEAGAATPPVRITLPDGTAVRSDEPDVDARLSLFFGRDVHLGSSAPEDFTIDQYHPDVEMLDPAGHRDTLVEQKLGSAFFAQAGLPSPVPVGSFLDLFPVSVLTTSTLDQLHDVRPESRFDERRFRMNVIVSTPQRGFVEHDWVGRGLELGDGVRLRVTMPDPRCVMTTLAQDDLPQDMEILRTLSRHNRVPVGGAGKFPCAGVYAVVESPGMLRTGESVVLR